MASFCVTQNLFSELNRILRALPEDILVSTGVALKDQQALGETNDTTRPPFRH